MHQRRGTNNTTSLWGAALMATCLLMWLMHQYKLAPVLQVTLAPSQRSSMRLPPESHEVPQLLTGLASYQGAEIVLLSFTNSAYLQWALNWAQHCSKLKAPHAVVAYDAQAAAALQMNGIDVYDLSDEAAALGLPATSSFRDQSVYFRLMGYLKVRTALKLQQQHTWQAVVVSDPDVVWLRHPAALLSLYPTADIMVSTDCLSAHAVAEGRTDVPRCQMVPGGWTSAWNTGIVIARNTPAAAAAMQEWSNRLAPDAPSHNEEGWWIDDQLGFSNVMDEGSIPFQSAEPVVGSAEGGGTGSTNGSTEKWQYSHVLWAWGKRVKIQPLPPLVLANGHVAFEQQLPEQLGTTPFAVHVTFQTYHANAGKLSRMMENNYWLLDPPEHFTGKFVTYSNRVEQWIDRVAQVWKQHTGRDMVLLHKHLLAAAYQLQVLAEAIAAARVLQRVLVPPKFICYCWQDSSAFTDMLYTCNMNGADKQPPMNCSSSMFVNVGMYMDSYLQHLRFPNFLEHPRMQQSTVQGSSVGVRVVDTSAAAALWDVPMADIGSRRIVLPVHASDMDLVNRCASHAGASVIDFGGLAPGWLAGLSQQADVDFADLMYNLTGLSGWCCLLTESVDTGQDMAHAYIGYQVPHLAVAIDTDADVQGKQVSAGASLAGGTRTTGSSSSDAASVLWRPADELFVRPDWCSEDAGYLKPYNFNVSLRQQHPCTYLAGVDYTAQLKEGVAAALGDVHRLRQAGSTVVL